MIEMEILQRQEAASTAAQQRQAAQVGCHLPATTVAQQMRVGLEAASHIILLLSHLHMLYLFSQRLIKKLESNSSKSRYPADGLGNCRE